jgi:hypothetical protein
MSISGVSSNASPYQSGIQPNYKQAKADFKTLASALQSGDINGAQKAVAALQKDIPQLQSQAAQTAPEANPFSDLMTAIQSGDLKAAQQALITLLQAAKSHHHHRQAASAQSDVSVTDPVDTSSTSDTDGTPPLLNATA